MNNNSPIQDYVHPEDQTQPTFDNSPYGLSLFIAGEGGGEGGGGGCAGEFRGGSLDFWETQNGGIRS